MGRNEQTDAGRKGAPSKTKAEMASQMSVRDAKGDWAPAYGGGQGQIPPADDDD